MEILRTIVDFLNGYIWSFPAKAPLLIVLLLGAGFFVTARLGFIEDGFNLYGLRQYVSNFNECLDVILVRRPAPPRCPPRPAPRCPLRRSLPPRRSERRSRRPRARRRWRRRRPRSRAALAPHRLLRQVRLQHQPR